MARFSPRRERFLRTGNLPLTFCNVLPGYESKLNYKIADPGYPLTPYCTKEFQYCIENKQVIFNNMFRGAPNKTECAFG